MGKEKKNRCSYDQDCFSFGLDWIEKIIYFLVINYYNLYEYLGLILWFDKNNKMTIFLLTFKKNAKFIFIVFLIFKVLK